MAITRRTFIKFLGGGITGLGLTKVVLKREGWAAAVPPAKTKGAKRTTSICSFGAVGCGQGPTSPF